MFCFDLKGTSIVNPFKSKAPYSHLAPWMGGAVRKGDVIPKTEKKKGLKKRQTGQTEVNRWDEDRIMTLLEQEPVSNKIGGKRRKL